MLPEVPSSSFMIAKGGDVQMLRMILVNAFLQFMNPEEDGLLDFNLYRYREQLMKGSMTVREDGVVFAYLPTLN